MKTNACILIICCFSILGCIKDREYTTITAVWKNNTGQEISVATYNFGHKNDTIKISPLGEFQVANNGRRGTVTLPSFSSPYIGDSSIVVFDGKYTITHYSSKVVTPSVKNYYDYTSAKNLQIFKNYEFTSVKINKYNSVNHHVYYFTEDQFIDATK